MELDFASICEAVSQRRPDDECLVFGHRRFTWAQMQDRTRRLASVLLAAGIRPTNGPDPGDRIALYLLNGNEYLEGMLGSWKARAVPFNVNYRYVAGELTYLLEDSGARAVIVHDRFVPTLARVLPRLESPPSLILAVSDGSERIEVPGLRDYEQALEAANPELPSSIVDGWSGDDIYLCYTGGTTGMPKGAMWRQGDFLVAALGVTRKDGSEFASVDEVAAAARSRMRALPAPPLMHGAAHWNAMSAWIAGGTVVIQDVVDHFDPLSILDTVRNESVTSLLLVGDPMARPLLDHIEATRPHVSDAGTLRHIISGGAVLSPESKNRLLEAFPGVRIIDVLGSTESGRQGTVSTTAASSGATGFDRGESAVVLSEDMSGRVEPGSTEVGWLAQSGRVPIGYLNDPAKTAATFPTIGGIRYAVAGDRARLLEDGSIDLLGRDSVCINTGGEKVFAEEVETALKSHPGVFDAVVCGVRSERFGEEVGAVVALRGDSDPSDEDLRERVAKDLARYKLPRRIVRRDSIVRSPSGKADYRWAKEQFSTVEQPADSASGVQVDQRAAD